MKKQHQKEKSIKELIKKLQECEKEKAEYLAGWQRCRADFLNYKNEELKKIEQLKEYLKGEIFLKILKIFDNFERAKIQLPENLKNSDWVKGILQIGEQFKNFFQREGLEEINPLGKKFDPNFHEAIDEVEMREKESGTIVEVLEKGYLLKGQLLRPAKVKVVK